jgi:hypothetical protein
MKNLNISFLLLTSYRKKKKNSILLATFSLLLYKKEAFLASSISPFPPFGKGNPFSPSFPSLSRPSGCEAREQGCEARNEEAFRGKGKN